MSQKIGLRGEASCFLKIWVKEALNFDSGPKRYSETRQTAIKVLVESELLVLALSNMA